MRLTACAAFSLTLVVLAGCNGDEGQTWAGPPDPADDGTVVVEDFAAHLAAVDEKWEGSPAMTAAEFLRLDERTAARTTIDETAPAEGAGPATVVVTLDGLLDDSVRAERWTLQLEPDGETYTLTAAQWAQRCQPGRGRQDFSTEPCI